MAVLWGHKKEQSWIVKVIGRMIKVVEKTNWN
jgi:hypothetical protein